MPLMMEAEMDMDDLFGDGPGLAIPSRPPSKELYQRVDELRASGCCQAIAWSKWGSIATISTTGCSVELRNLRCHPENGTWAMSEPSIPSFSSNQDGGPLKYLSWSPTGCDLAVIDSVGRVSILSLFSSLNKPALNRSCQLDAADDLHAVVGSYWLPQSPYPAGRPAIQYGPAVKEGAGFRYDASQAPILGPFHPIHSKSALIFLTTNGLLRLLWQQNNNKWCESHTELESIIFSDELITHAAMCPDKNGTLLIAFATTSKQLRTVRAVIEWGTPKAEKVPAAQFPLNPTIRTRHLAVTNWAHDKLSDSLNGLSVGFSMAELSFIEFLPPASDSNGKLALPTILTVRSRLPVSTTHYNQDVQTIFDRWEVRDQPQTLHSAFEQLGARRSNVGSQHGTSSYLKKMESFTVNKIAIGLEVIHLGKVIFVAYSDGSVEYRERVGFSEIFHEADLSRVSHLSQVGFSYADVEPCLQVALSPTNYSLVQIKNDGKFKWNKLVYHSNDFGTSMEDSPYASAIAALTLAIGTAVYRNHNLDDLLATAHEYSTPQFAYDWLTEIARILKIQMDYSEDTHHDVLVRNISIQLCLSVQNSLGFKGELRPRTFSGKFAWLVLQLRNIVVLISMAANLTFPGPNPNEKILPLEDPEVINSLAGSVRWVMDFIAWIIDSLLTLSRNVPDSIDLKEGNNLSLPELLSYLHSTNTISLHLLLSSSTRGFLTSICRRLQYLDFIARRAIMHPVGAYQNSNPNQPNSQTSPLSPSLRAAYRQLAILTSKTILKFQTTEKLLHSVSSAIKIAYANSSSGASGSEKTRNNLETKMLLGGSFPDAFKPVIVELFKIGGLLQTIRDDIDPARLFFADFSLLDVDEDIASVRKREKLGATIDSFKKRWMPNPWLSKCARTAGDINTAASDTNATGSSRQQYARWRRCARCAAVMEDVLPQKPALQWLVMQQRRCYCSGYWDTLPAGEPVA